MFKQYTMELAGRTLRVDVGRVCAQANGAALMHYGDTVVLSTATASKEPREGIDFFPLSVEFEEMYAVGKIPGGFNKREGKASENAILTSRVIDRPMRPLFPKDYRNDVTLNNMVMAVDPECRPEHLHRSSSCHRRLGGSRSPAPDEWRELLYASQSLAFLHLHRPLLCHLYRREGDEDQSYPHDTLLGFCRTGITILNKIFRFYLVVINKNRTFATKRR